MVQLEVMYIQVREVDTNVRLWDSALSRRIHAVRRLRFNNYVHSLNYPEYILTFNWRAVTFVYISSYMYCRV